MSFLFKVFAVALVAMFSVGAAHAQKSEVYTGFLSNTAVEGYDAVSFFDGTPVKGSREYSTTYKGADWRFASAENLAKFEANPTAYAPKYGGYCAWAAAEGYTAKGDPDYWTIVDGKLYLNFNADVQKKWEADIPGFIAKADANWPGILGN